MQCNVRSQRHAPPAPLAAKMRAVPSRDAVATLSPAALHFADASSAVCARSAAASSIGGHAARDLDHPPVPAHVLRQKVVSAPDGLQAAQAICSGSG